MPICDDYTRVVNTSGTHRVSTPVLAGLRPVKSRTVKYNSTERRIRVQVCVPDSIALPVTSLAEHLRAEHSLGHVEHLNAESERHLQLSGKIEKKR